MKRCKDLTLALNIVKQSNRNNDPDYGLCTFWDSFFENRKTSKLSI